MISYRRFWRLLSQKGISQYELQRVHGISALSLYALRHDQYVYTTLLDRLCEILQCSVTDLLEEGEEDHELSSLILALREKEHQEDPPC